MCAPGSACCTCSTASSGLGLAAGVVAGAAVVSAAATLITDILTAALVAVFSVVAVSSALLAVLLRRTRGATWSPRRAVAAAPLQPAAPGRPLAAPALRALPAGAAAPPAIEPRRPLALEGARIAVPAGADGLPDAHSDRMAWIVAETRSGAGQPHQAAGW